MSLKLGLPCVRLSGFDVDPEALAEMPQDVARSYRVMPLMRHQWRLVVAIGEYHVVTVEDPVEYRLDGIVQTQAHAAIEYGFSTALRHILRHDPDVVLIGEIRDRETASIAVESALTGHLVLSTLHTNGAVQTITRLVEMGVESYLVSSTLAGVLAQRLAKRNCQYCREPETVDAEIGAALGVGLEETFFKGPGCPRCGGLAITAARRSMKSCT